MAINLATGFSIGSKDVIDERQVLTLNQMQNLDENVYPDNYFAICKDDGKLYIFNASNEINAETGKFRVLSGGTGGGDTTYVLPPATDTTLGGVKVDNVTITVDSEGVITAINSYTKTEVDDLLNNKLDKPTIDGTAGQILVLQDDGSLAYADNVGGGTADLTEINNKLSELETNQIKKSYVNRLADNSTCIIKITPNGITAFSKILITDLYGVCILITGAKSTDNSVKTFKVVKISNGSWFTNSPSSITFNKIQNIYFDGSFIYLTVGNYSNLYFEGGFSRVETIDTLPTEATELPILDLTQAASKRVYNSLEELNTAKGLSLSLTNDEDNTMKIVDALSPVETFADYFTNELNSNRFGIDTLTYGTHIALLTITKFDNTMAIIRAYMFNGKLLVRRYTPGGLGSWYYDKTDLTEINTKLVQLETKQINKTSISDMSPTPVCYKITPKDNNTFSKILIVDLYGGCLLITGSIIPDYKSLKAVRLSNGCWESYSASNNVANKIESVYYDGSYIYVNCLNYIKINFEGGFTNIEKIDSLPSNTTQIPILDLTQGNSVDLTDINDRLTQLENTTSGGNTNNDVYSTEEQAVGTWINGKTLYRRTIEDNTLRETGTDMIKLFAYNTNMKIVKFEGVVTLANDNGQTFVRSLPYNKGGEEIYVTKTTLDTLRLDSYLTNYKLGGYIVSVYYYKI